MTEKKMITLENEFRTAVITPYEIAAFNITLLIDIRTCEDKLFSFKQKFNIPKLIEAANPLYKQTFISGFDYNFIPGLCIDEFGDLRLCLKISETFEDCPENANDYVVLADSDNIQELIDMMKDIDDTIYNSIMYGNEVFTAYSSYEEVDSFIPLIDLTYFIQCK